MEKKFKIGDLAYVVASGNPVNGCDLITVQGCKVFGVDDYSGHSICNVKFVEGDDKEYRYDSERMFMSSEECESYSKELSNEIDYCPYIPF